MSSLEDDSNESDVILEVDGETFHCNKHELAKQSPYFQAMFSVNFAERHKDSIRIQDVDAGAMKFLLQWTNDTSQVDSLGGEEVLVVLQAAAMLQFESLQHACEEVMVQRWLSPESCLLTAATADQLSLTKLHQKALALALWHFSEVRHTQAFLNLPPDALVLYLNQDALSLGRSSDEFQVFEAASSWLEHNMAERLSETLAVLSCVRMNFISLSDIRSMINYACIDNSREAQLLLRCILHIKEGKKINRKEETAVQEETILTSEDKNGCCDSFKKIADHLIACGSEVISENVSTVVMGNCDIEQNENAVSVDEFSTDILLKAQNILDLKQRQLPTIACIVGRIMDNEEHASSAAESNVPTPSLTKKNRKEKTRSGSPYIFYVDADKSDKPIPLLPLTKVNQGPTEALGYSVISRGLELFVIGGEYLLGYGNWNKSIWKYNVWSETWSFETSLTVPRRHHSVVCLEDDLYIIGGFGKFRVIMDSMDRYNFSSRTWHKCAPLPSSLYSAAVCVFNNFIYVIDCQIFCFYPASNSWSTLSDIIIPPGSRFNTAMPHEGHIYLSGPYSSVLMRFDPVWEKRIECVGSFQNTCTETCVVGNRIYSFSEDDDGSCVEMYDIPLGTFKVLWRGNPLDDKISFKKSGGCFPLVLYESLWRFSKNT